MKKGLKDMNTIRLYSTYSTVRNVYEQGWLDIDPLVSPVDGTAILVGASYSEDEVSLSDPITITTSTTLTASSTNYIKVDASAGPITITFPAPTTPNIFYFITFSYRSVLYLIKDYFFS